MRQKNVLGNPVLLAKHRREIPGYYPRSKWSSCSKLFLALALLCLVALSLVSNYESLYDYTHSTSSVTVGTTKETMKKKSLRSPNGTMSSRIRTPTAVGVTTVLREKDLCASQWSSDSMRGKCFGLKSIEEFDSKQEQPGGFENSSNKKRYSLAECRKACCMREKCDTWQVAQQTGQCQIGGPVRLGLESADTVDWCEPLPPAKWLGRFVGSRRSGKDKDRCPAVGLIDFDGKKIDLAAERSGQCFGLGPERMKDGKRVKSRHDCEEECCENQFCVLYQWHKDRGCFFNDEKANSDFNCGAYNGTYSGGRKNIVIKT